MNSIPEKSRGGERNWLKCLPQNAIVDFSGQFITILTPLLHRDIPVGYSTEIGSSKFYPLDIMLTQKDKDRVAYALYSNDLSALMPEVSSLAHAIASTINSQIEEFIKNKPDELRKPVLVFCPADSIIEAGKCGNIAYLWLNVQDGKFRLESETSFYIKGE